MSRSSVLVLYVAALGLSWSMTAFAIERSNPDAPVVEPQVDRRQVSIPHIYATDIELGVYTGLLNVENFGTKKVDGYRLAYHVTDRVFVEGIYGTSTVSDQFYRDKAFPLFDTAIQKLTYYNVSLGYNLLPGESFVTKNWAFSSAFYFVAGLGSTKFAKESFATFSYGFGYRMLLTDWLAFHIDMRDHVFNSDIFGTSQRTNNFELTTGITFFF